MPQATRLAAAIKTTFGLDAELIEGGNGIFDVVAEGNMIFSKYESGRFPEHEEVIEAIRRMESSPAGPQS